MFEIFEEWFGQGFQLGVVIVDVLAIIIGVLITIHTGLIKTKLVAIAGCLATFIICSLCMDTNSYFQQILALILGGLSVLIIIGIIIGIPIKHIKIVFENKRKLEQEQK